MVRLLRPYIPIPVRLQVIERQITAAGRSTVIFDYQSKKDQLEALLAFTFENDPVHLDHDPPLGAREKVFKAGEHVGYKPDANDPDFLIYRKADLHRLKTNVRGDHGQHPDRVLIKKARRLERGPKPKKSTWPKRPFPKRKS